MTDSFFFLLKYKNKSESNYKKYNFNKGLNVIYGESGIGKSEFIRSLSNNAESDIFSVKEKSIDENIHIILQNPDLQIIGNSIENELAFNLEYKSNDSIQIQNKLNSTIQYLLFDVDVKRHPATLSGGEKELLNISTTLSLTPKIILIDDALSFLSDEMKEKVIDQFNNQKDSIILWFTSDIRDLRFGRTKWEMNSDEIIELKSVHKFENLKIEVKKGNFNLNIKKLQFQYEANKPIFSNFSHSIDTFRCLGITGDNGTGKSTLASLLLKIEKPNTGSIKLKTINDEKFIIGYLDQFPEKLLGIMTINDFVNQLIEYDKLDASDIEKIETDFKLHGIYWTEIKNKTSLDISWTVIRFILIFILANSTYEILILDEPTFGMGHQQKLNLRSYFVRYLNKKHLILISHDKLFLNSLCDSIIKL